MGNASPDAYRATTAALDAGREVVLTITLTLPAAVPTTAGPISRTPAARPVGELSTGRKPTPSSEGNWTRNWRPPPMSVPIAIPMMAHCAADSGTAPGSRTLVQPPPLSQ